MNEHIIRSTFSNSVNPFLNNILIHNNDISFFLNMMTIGLVFFALFAELINFMLDGLDIQRIATSLIFIIAALALSNHYTSPIDVIWNAFDDISLSFLKEITGNNDPLYLSKWVNDRLIRLVSNDPSVLTDSIHILVMSMLWHIAAVIIELIMYLAGSWAVWGMILTKLLGVLFIPCLAWQPTRQFFDVYIRFFAGFVMLLITLRATSALAAISINAEFKTMGIGCYGVISCVIKKGVSFNPTNNIEMIVVIFLSIILVMSSFKISRQFSQACGAASSGAMGIVKKGIQLAAAI